MLHPYFVYSSRYQIYIHHSPKLNDYTDEALVSNPKVSLGRQFWTTGTHTVILTTNMCNKVTLSNLSLALEHGLPFLIFL
jgi:hypothetical protein